MALRQVSWLGPPTAIGDAAFSRFPAQWRTKRRSKGLTVAVTTRDSHPLPYSLAAGSDEHLKALTKNLKVSRDNED
jgi:hypothetical protein